MSCGFKVTRIVLCYLQWESIRSWLDSELLHGPGIEWIIVNDYPLAAAPDWILEIATRRQIKIVAPLLNVGRSNARNLGASYASGEWLDFIDGDDIPLRVDLNLFSQQIASVGLIACPVVGFNKIDEVDLENPPEFPDAWTADNILQEEMFPRFIPIDSRPCGTLWRKSTFVHLGGFDARFDDAWQDAHLVWKAHYTGIMCGRINVAKQAYNLGESVGLGSRLTEASIFNLMKCLKTHSDGRLSDVFAALEVDALSRLRTQALFMLQRSDRLTWIYLLKEFARLVRLKVFGR